MGGDPEGGVAMDAGRRAGATTRPYIRGRYESRPGAWLLPMVPSLASTGGMCVVVGVDISGSWHPGRGNVHFHLSAAAGKFERREPLRTRRCLEAVLTDEEPAIVMEV